MCECACVRVSVSVELRVNYISLNMVLTFTLFSKLSKVSSGLHPAVLVHPRVFTTFTHTHPISSFFFFTPFVIHPLFNNNNNNLTIEKLNKKKKKLSRGYRIDNKIGKIFFVGGVTGGEWSDLNNRFIKLKFNLKTRKIIF